MFRGKKGIGANSILLLIFSMGGFWIITQYLLIGGGLSLAGLFASPVLIATVIVFLIIFMMGGKK